MEKSVIKNGSVELVIDSDRNSRFVSINVMNNRVQYFDSIILDKYEVMEIIIALIEHKNNAVGHPENFK